MEELFLTLLAMSGAGAVAIIGVCLARLALGRAPMAVSYALWAVVLFRLLCPFAPRSGLSVVPDLQEAVRTDYVAVIPVTAEPGALPELPANEEGEVPAGPPAPVLRWRDAAWRIWLAGVLVLAAAGLLSLLRLRRSLAEAIPLEPGVYLAERIPSPFVLGLFRPAVYLPAGLSETEREYILLHERTHIRRLDHITRTLAWAALCLHWFNPLVWLAFRLAGRDMELSCDEAVLRRMGRDIRADYSKTLLRMSALRCPGPLAFGGGDLKSRIRNILRYRKPAPWVLAAALTAAACMIGVLATSRSVREAPASREAEMWLDFYHVEGLSWDESSAIQIPDYPDATFHWTPGQVSEGTFEQAAPLFSGMPIWNVFFCDLTGDGLRELCATVSFGSGIIDTRVLAYDYSTGITYTLEDRGKYDYALSLEGGELRVTKSVYNGLAFSTGGLAAAGEGLLEMTGETLLPATEAEPPSVSTVEAGIPTASQVLEARKRVLRGMTEEQVRELTETVKTANLWWEQEYMRHNIFQKLEDPNSLYWNYFDRTGEIQIDWAYDGGTDMEAVCREEGLTEDQFYERYGTPVVVENQYDTSRFLSRLRVLRAWTSDEGLTAVLNALMDDAALAQETHIMTYANNLYRRLHDLDYFLFRYGPEDVGPYVEDASTVSRYYGTLSLFYS